MSRNGLQPDDEALWIDSEGLFDAQLALPLAFAPAPPPFRTVIKRDGREEPFDKRKIAEAIFKAAQTLGGEDRPLAESLANAVSIYLGKQVKPGPPTVDHVHDAVERVLIEMSHVQTALAYVRYRDRRARIRRLREGDARALLSELEEARHEREARGGAPGPPLFVRTSADTLTTWDRARIREALVRETGLDPGIAELAAFEVEMQIEKAQLRTLTAPLIRELVGAKLVELGLEEFRGRHRRLGVPLYDTERILRGATPETAGADPVETDRAIARAVKKEYALAQVFSGPVAESHLRGEMHVHHLDRIDRLDHAELIAGRIARHGIGLPGTASFASPPKYADTLLAQLVKSSELHGACIAGGIGWDALNVYLAPYLHDWSEHDLRQFSQMLIYEFAYRALTAGESAADVEIGVCWTVPGELRGAAAAGPPGAPEGRSYGAYQHTAQRVAWALLEIFREGGAGGGAFPAPLPRIMLDAGFFRADGHAAFLGRAAALAAERRPVRFVFHRGEARALPMAAQQVTLNLPRAAFVGRGEAGLLKELDRLTALAALAHSEKRAFIEPLLDAERRGPLALAADAEYGELAYLLAVDGIQECAAALIGDSDPGGNEAHALAARILEFLAERCGDYGRRHGLTLLLAQNNDDAVSRRFATLDAQQFQASAAAVITAVPEGAPLSYTTGVRLRPLPGQPPFERIAREGALHALLEAGQRSEAPLPEGPLSQQSLADFVRKVFVQTECGGISFL